MTRPVELEQPSRPAAAAGDASRSTSPATQDASRRACAWCGGRVPGRSRRDAIYCGVVCRKRAWRFKRAVPRRPRGPVGRVPFAPGGSPARFAYADPPYPGKAGYYAERQEVDHASLLEQLADGWPDGWALSTSAAALRDVLPMCPAGISVCAWRRRVRPTRAKAPLSAWEPLIVYRGRALQTGRVQTVLDHLDYRGRYDAMPGALVGMKPPEFAVWMFTLLGAQPGDELDDLFPGSGVIGRAWALYTSRGPAVDARDASLASPTSTGDGSGE